ncbi:hypothetical protein EIP86_008924 [Pleurotus ostreatoroseus]|nr:hypothetical protein EIP86_008924 [Pleurotus ostreatoroseus]
MPLSNPRPARIVVDEDSDDAVDLNSPDVDAFLTLVTCVEEGVEVKDEDALREWMFGELLDIMEEARLYLDFRERVEAVKALTTRLYLEFPTRSWLADVRAVLPEVADPPDSASSRSKKTSVPNGPPPKEPLFLPSPSSTSPLSTAPNSGAATPAKGKPSAAVIRRPLPISAALRAQLKKRGLLDEASPSEVESSDDDEDEDLFSPEEEDELEDDVPVALTIRTRSAALKAKSSRSRTVMEVVLPLRHSARLKKTQAAKTAAKKARKTPKKSKNKRTGDASQEDDVPPRGRGRPRKTTVDTENRKVVRIAGSIGPDGRRKVSLVDTDSFSKHWRAYPWERIRWRTDIVDEMCDFCRQTRTAAVCIAVGNSGKCKWCIESHKKCQGMDHYLLNEDYRAAEERDHAYFRSLPEWDEDPIAAETTTPILVEIGVQAPENDLALPSVLPDPSPSITAYRDAIIQIQGKYDNLARQRDALEDQMRELASGYRKVLRLAEEQEMETAGNGSAS